MGKLILYGLDASPPVRACLMTLKCLDLPFEYKIVNVLTGEQLQSEYVKKNPQHTVPTLEDDGHIIWDSHVIMTYLVEKYAKDDSLYPKDLLKRAIVDQRLFFEACHLFESGLRNITVPLVFFNEKHVKQRQIENVRKICRIMEDFLDDHAYMAGDQLTVADFSIISTASILYPFVDIDVEFPKLSAWIKRMQTLPYYNETNGKGAQDAIDIINGTNFVIVP